MVEEVEVEAVIVLSTQVSQIFNYNVSQRLSTMAAHDNGESLALHPTFTVVCAIKVISLVSTPSSFNIVL
jgi:hypothetical protein